MGNLGMLMLLGHYAFLYLVTFIIPDILRYAAFFPCNGLIPSIVFFDFDIAQYKSKSACKPNQTSCDIPK